MDSTAGQPASLGTSTAAVGHSAAEADDLPTTRAASPADLTAASAGQTGDLPTTPASEASGPAPKVLVGQEDYDFGKMETDNAGEHEFVFANTGGAPLVLKEGKSSCGCCTCVCEVRLPEGGKIAPGESAGVTLKWTIKRFTGTFRQSVTILSNDPHRPEVALGVSGKIIPAVLVVPWRVIFSRVSLGQTASTEVRVYGYRPEPLEIVDCRLSDPSAGQYFETEVVGLSADQLAAQTDARSGFTLRVKLKPGLPLGPFRRQIVLGTNLDSAATLEVPVEGVIVAAVSIVGRGWDEKAGVLKLPAAGSNGTTERKLILLARGPHREQVKFKVVRVVPEFVKVELGQSTPLGKGKLVQTSLSVRIPAGSQMGTPPAEAGQIVIDTNHPHQPQLKIPLEFGAKD